MKLSNKEKVILAVFLSIVILAAGAFLLVVPEYQKIEGNQSSLNSAKSQRDQLYNTLTRESTIDQELEDAAKDAEEYADFFYDDMTTYEADAMFREIIANAYKVDAELGQEVNLELKTDSLEISDFTTSTLTVDNFVKTYVTYPLKEYSGYKEVSGLDLSAYNLNYDENGNVIMDEAYEAAVADIAENLLKDIKRLGLSMQNQTIGSITADFEIECTRQQYLDFLDYVHGLEHATYISSARINYTKAVESEDTTEGQFTYDEEGNIVPVPAREPDPDENKVQENDVFTYKVNMTLYCVTELQTEEETTEAVTEPPAEETAAA